MTVTLKLDHPHFPDDAEFGIEGLGRIKNHGTLEVDDDDVKLFEAARGMTIADAFDGNGLITVEGSSLSPKTEATNENSDNSAVGSDNAATTVTPLVPVTNLTPVTDTNTQDESGEQ